MTAKNETFVECKIFGVRENSSNWNVAIVHTEKHGYVQAWTNRDMKDIPTDRVGVIEKMQKSSTEVKYFLY